MPSPLIIALDTDSLEEAENIIKATREFCSIYKVGLELFTAAGPQSIQLIKRHNAEVFLDLKLHDIPNTVAKTVEQSIKHDVRFLTIHALAGPKVLQVACQMITQHKTRLQILAVSVLTHHDEAELKNIGLNKSTENLVADLLQTAFNVGAHGAICSPLEARSVRQQFGSQFIIVCPGIRPANTALNDQTRIATPALAMQNGANFLVVGRPITKAADKKNAAAAIFKEIQEGICAKSTIQ
ncbi:MAG: orotidine-5'-phosphate decarboxylase [bacterium]|nr:orotidine-5'-phosphate decarboxylase [bacterium]